MHTISLWTGMHTRIGMCARNIALYGQACTLSLYGQACTPALECAPVTYLSMDMCRQQMCAHTQMIRHAFTQPSIHASRTSAQLHAHMSTQAHMRAHLHRTFECAAPPHGCGWGTTQHLTRTHMHTQTHTHTCRCAKNMAVGEGQHGKIYLGTHTHTLVQDLEAQLHRMAVDGGPRSIAAEAELHQQRSLCARLEADLAARSTTVRKAWAIIPGLDLVSLTYILAVPKT